jgi:uncharacterized protein
VTVQVLRARDRRATPWKNGGGVTREIAAFPRGAGLDSFEWRVSMASVTAGGPFSIFPGVDRVLSVLEGELTLTFEDGAALTLTARSEPAAFGGDVAVSARTPTAPVTDLNVMTRRGQVRASVSRPRGDSPRTATAGETTLILSLSPGVQLRHAGAVYRLELHDGVLFEGVSGEVIGLDAAGPATVFQIDLTRVQGDRPG